MGKTFTSFFVLFILFCGVCGDILIVRGFYRTGQKSPRIFLRNVQALDDNTVANASYIKVNAAIPRLFEKSVRHLYYLRNLSLSLCGIIDISPGAFNDLPNLDRLNLKQNGIDHIREGIFNNLNISVLYLNRNKIKTIDSKAFDNMPNLAKIKLNSNEISVWNIDWFHNTPFLMRIFFRRNDIEELPENTLNNIEGCRKAPYLRCPNLYLSNNRISVIHPKAFKGVEDFGQIWLDRNKLQRIDEAVFSEIKMISGLILARNNITALPKNLFTDTRVGILDVSANCRLKFLPNEILKKIKTLIMTQIKTQHCPNQIN